MADTKLTDLTALTGASSDTADLFHIVDVSDTTLGASGTNKKMTRAELQAALEAEGLATGKQSLYFPASSMIPRTTNGAGYTETETTTNNVMLATMNFDTASDEFVQFSFRAPKSWNESTITAAFVWSHPSTATNFGVAWAIQGLSLGDSDAADAAFGTAVVTTDTGGTTDDIYHSAESSAVTLAGTPAENDLLIFQVYRDVSDAGDDLAVDARLHGVTLFLTTNASTDD